MDYESRLAELGLTLPEPPPLVGNYIGFRQVGDYAELGGVVPNHNGENIYTGKVGRELTLEQGYDAARYCALNHLAILKSALGSLDRVDHLVRMIGFINAAPGFNSLPPVLDGASDVFVHVLGDRGRHARAAIGVAELDLDFPVETVLTVKVKPA